MDKNLLFKSNLAAVIIVGTLFAAIGFFQGDTSRAIVTLTGTYSVLIILLIARKTLPLKYCIYLVAFLGFFAMFIPPTLRNEATDSFTLFLGFNIAFGLYFKRRLTLFVALLTNFSFLFFVFVLGMGMPEGFRNAEVIFSLSTLNVGLVLLYILVASTEKFLSNVRINAQNQALQIKQQNNMMDDLSTLIAEYIDNGDFEYRIDPSTYDDAHAVEVINGMNNLVHAATQDMEVVLHTLENINKGNFTFESRKLPGKKVVLNNALDLFTENLLKIKNNMLSSVHAVTHGDLEAKVCTENYTGEWLKLMNGLNEITTAVREPLKVIELCMIELQSGNFDLSKIDKTIRAAGYTSNLDNYHGSFRDTLATYDRSANDISSYINELELILAEIAKGDLTQTIDRNYVGSFDAIRRSVNNIVITLRRTMSEITSASEQVLSGAGQISSNATELANGASEQAHSVEELGTSIELINNALEADSKNTKLAESLGEQSTQNANIGHQSMGQMLEAIGQIKDSSDSISKIIKVIQDIAFQTNLLALNASVEAARAGEHGRGFAVVAEEVRTLAGRSKTAAEQTTQLIENSINRVDTGSQIASGTSASLDDIMASTDSVIQLIGAISHSVGDQVSAIKQVNTDVSRISSVVQHNSAISQETASAAEELNSQAELLRKLVSYFKI